MLIPLQDLIIEKADLVFLGVLSGFVCEIVVPYFSCYLVIFGDVLQIDMVLVLLRNVSQTPMKATGQYTQVQASWDQYQHPATQMAFQYQSSTVGREHTLSRKSEQSAGIRLHW